jgi:hypothetical protein
LELGLIFGIETRVGFMTRFGSRIGTENLKNTFFGRKNGLESRVNWQLTTRFKPGYLEPEPSLISKIKTET